MPEINGMIGVKPISIIQKAWIPNYKRKSLRYFDFKQNIIGKIALYEYCLLYIITNNQQCYEVEKNIN